MYKVLYKTDFLMNGIDEYLITALPITKVGAR
jgi:hypothetical protein